MSIMFAASLSADPALRSAAADLLDHVASMSLHDLDRAIRMTAAGRAQPADLDDPHAYIRVFAHWAATSRDIRRPGTVFKTWLSRTSRSAVSARVSRAARRRMSPYAGHITRGWMGRDRIDAMPPMPALMLLIKELADPGGCRRAVHHAA